MDKKITTTNKLKVECPNISQLVKSRKIQILTYAWAWLMGYRIITREQYANKAGNDIAVLPAVHVYIHL